MGDPDHRNIFDGNAEDARVIRDMAKARRWLDLADNPKHLRLMGLSHENAEPTSQSGRQSHSNLT